MSNVAKFERAPVYRCPEPPKVRIRVLRPFYWREELLQDGVRTPLSPSRVVQPGETLDAYEPDALSLIAAKRAERCT